MANSVRDGKLGGAVDVDGMMSRVRQQTAAINANWRAIRDDRAPTSTRMHQPITQKKGKRDTSVHKRALAEADTWNEYPGFTRTSNAGEIKAIKLGTRGAITSALVGECRTHCDKDAACVGIRIRDAPRRGGRRSGQTKCMLYSTWVEPTKGDPKLDFMARKVSSA